MNFDRLVRTEVSGLSPNDLEAVIDSMITIGNPTAIADSKNNNGRTGVCQRGCIFGPAIIIKVPKED